MQALLESFAKRSPLLRRKNQCKQIWHVSQKPAVPLREFQRSRGRRGRFLLMWPAAPHAELTQPIAIIDTVPVGWSPTLKCHNIKQCPREVQSTGLEGRCSIGKTVVPKPPKASKNSTAVLFLEALGGKDGIRTHGTRKYDGFSIC